MQGLHKIKKVTKPKRLKNSLKNLGKDIKKEVKVKKKRKLFANF